MAYHDGQPFNDDHLRPCPMLENPDKLREMVAKTGAHQTNEEAPEEVDQLCGKCDHYSQLWTDYLEHHEIQRKREHA